MKNGNFPAYHMGGKKKSYKFCNLQFKICILSTPGLFALFCFPDDLLQTIEGIGCLLS